MYREPVTFQEAEAQLNERMDTPTAMKYTDILLAWDAEARQHAFFSARVAEASILAELHSRVQAVVEGRMTADQARRLIRNYFAGEGADALARLGFAPPRDAHGVAELASIARINLILETNVRFAQETAHYRRWETLRKAYPYGIWRCGVCDEHRPEHLARDGRAYAFEHPIWTQSPPGGEFNCHCTRELCSEKDLERLGLKPEPLGSDFEPSSLGFDPSRGLQPPPPSAKTPPEIAEAAEKAVDRDAQTPNSPANPDSIPNLKPGALPEVPSLPPPPVRPAPRRPDATAYEPRRPVAPEEPAPAPAAPSAEPASPEPATVSAPSAPSGVTSEPPGRVSLTGILKEKLARFKEKLSALWRGGRKQQKAVAQKTDDELQPPRVEQERIANEEAERQKTSEEIELEKNVQKLKQELEEQQNEERESYREIEKLEEEKDNLNNNPEYRNSDGTVNEGIRNRIIEIIRRENEILDKNYTKVINALKDKVLAAVNAFDQYKVKLFNPSGYRKIKGPHSRNDDAKRTNKKYYEVPVNRQYSENCQRCVVAYEARRRGMDVVAKPVLDIANDRMSHGGWHDVFESSGLIAVSSRNDIETNMKDFGDGARAIVRIGWGTTGRDGHVFIAEQHGNRTIFIDPQNGSTNAENLFTRPKINMSTATLTRIDTCRFNDTLFAECCENAPE